MTDHIITVALAGLAAAYLIRAWRTGSIFASARSWLEAGQLVKVVRSQAVADTLYDLLTCPLCLSPYVSFICLCLIAALSPAEFSAAIFIEMFASAAIAVLLYPRMSLE